MRIPYHYLKRRSDEYLEIKLIAYNWVGVSATIFHTIYIQSIEYCDSDLGYIYIDQGNKQQIQSNWNNYPLSVRINSKQSSDFLMIRWYQESTPNVVGNKYQQFNFNNFKTKFDNDLVEWQYENNMKNDTILLPMWSTKHYHDYLFVVQVCDNQTLLCLEDYVFIRCKYPSPRSIIKSTQIEHIDPWRSDAPSSYKYNIDSFFNFNPLFLAQYNNDFELIYDENEYSWTFECNGVTSQGLPLSITCDRPTSIVGAFTRNSITDKAKIIELNMTATLIQSDNFISIYDLQSRQSQYPKQTMSHTIMFKIYSNQQTSVKYTKTKKIKNYDEFLITFLRNCILTLCSKIENENAHRLICHC